MSASLRRVIISTKKAPDAIGPYNQAVQVSVHYLKLLFVLLYILPDRPNNNNLEWNEVEICHSIIF